jgi:hypothetical protein
MGYSVYSESYSRLPKRIRVRRHSGGRRRGPFEGSTGATRHAKKVRNGPLSESAFTLNARRQTASVGSTYRNAQSVARALSP